ncbi:MAG: subtilisin-like proprotein convertase family protein, partial [Ulvibacter sp.]
MKKNTLSKQIFCIVLLFIVTITNYAQTTVVGDNNTVVPFIDNNTVNTAVPISGIPLGAIISNVEIDLAISHTWVGDLKIELVAPTGDVITTMDRPGNPTSTFGDSSNLLSTSPITFTDTAINDPELMGFSLGDAGIICLDDGACDYFPTPSFAVFTAAITASGIDPNGNWFVNITDNAAGDSGDFFVPELRVTYLIPNVGIDGSGNLVYSDIDGVDDDITIVVDGLNYRIGDPAGTLLAGPGATQDGTDVLVPVALVTG